MVKIPGTVIVGSQWGDEGKGKITDILAEKSDCVIRYQGGNNAGHTIVVKDNTYKLHLLPSGVIHGKKCMIASGVVLDPRVLVKEIEMLGEVNLMIDPLTSIIMPYHNIMDGIYEESQNIGTTQRGIGPAYEDKYARRGIRFKDMYDADFKQKISQNLIIKKKVAGAFGKTIELNEDQIFVEYSKLANVLKKYMGDVSRYVSENIDSKQILFESAQGTFLDITYGTYPYVTSSHPISGAVFTDVGFAPRQLNVIGVVKAYTTRVGEGPFPTELNDETAEHMRIVGKEIGTTTGRPRRCGWLDLDMIKKAHQLNGFTSLAVTKLDVLSGLDVIKVKFNNVLKQFDGFTIQGNGIDEGAKKYLKFIQESVGVKVSMLSLGPERSQVILFD